MASDLCRGRRHRRLQLRRPLLLSRFERLGLFRTEGGLRTRRRRRHRRVAILLSEVTCSRKGRFLLRLCRLRVPLVSGGDGGGCLLVHQPFGHRDGARTLDLHLAPRCRDRRLLLSLEIRS